MADKVQPSMAAGEIAPAEQARIDIAKFNIALKTLFNMFVHVSGGASNRAGTKFIGYAKSDVEGNVTRTIPFKFNKLQAFAMEFGPEYMRPIKNGAHVQDRSYAITGITKANPAVVDSDGHDFSDNDEVEITGVGGMFQVNGLRFLVNGVQIQPNAITAITKADPAVVSSTAHGFADGDKVYLTNIGGMIELNDRQFVVANKTANDFELENEDSTGYTTFAAGGSETITLSTFTLKTRDGVVVDSTAYTAYTSPGKVGRIYEISTPYVSSDLALLKTSQSADVVTLTHPDYDPRTLARRSDSDWTLSITAFAPQIGKPTAVTALQIEDTTNDDDSEYRAISAITQASPAEITLEPPTPGVDGPRLFEDEEVFINHCTGMIEINGGPYAISSTAANPVNIRDWNGNLINSGGFGAYTGNGRMGKLQHKYRVTAIDAITGEESLPSDEDDSAWTISFYSLSTTNRVKLTWSAPTDENVVEYAIYKEKNGIYGFIGLADTTEFYDDNIEPELGDTPPGTPARDPFNKTITAITKANPGVLTVTEHGYSNGDRVFIQNVGGMTEINDAFYLVDSATSTTFQITDLDGNLIDTNNFTAYTSGGTASDFPSCSTSFDQRRIYAPLTNNVEVVHATQVGNTKSFNKSRPSKAGDGVSFTIPGIEVNEIRWMVPLKNLWLFTAGSIWKSTSGDLPYTEVNIQNTPEEYVGVSNLVPPIPVKSSILYVEDDAPTIWEFRFTFETDSFDSVERSILANHIFEGKDIVSWGWAKSPHSLLWVILSDGRMATMTYNQKHDVWAWARHETPGTDSQPIGIVESNCAIPEASEYGVYFSIRRKINGTWRRMIERLESRVFTDVRDAFFVDSGLTLDDPKTVTGITKVKHPVVTATNHGFTENDLIDLNEVVGMTEVNDNRFRAAAVTSSTFRLVSQYLDLAGKPITGLTAANPPVVTVTAHGLSNGTIVFIESVGGMVEVNDLYFLINNVATDTFELQDMAGVDIVGAGYTAYTSGGTAKATAAIDGSAFTTYEFGGKARKAVLTIRGLDHLEGEKVSILADGNEHPEKTVASGAITLDDPASRVHVGLGYTSDLETLNIDTPDGRLEGRPKSVIKVLLKLLLSRGFEAGPNASKLEEWPQRDTEGYNVPIDLFTGLADQVLEPEWNTNGRVFIRQTKPLPLTVLSVGVNVEVGGE